MNNITIKKCNIKKQKLSLEAVVRFKAIKNLLIPFKFKFNEKILRGMKPYAMFTFMNKQLL